KVPASAWTTRTPSTTVPPPTGTSPVRARTVPGAAAARSAELSPAPQALSSPAAPSAPAPVSSVRLLRHHRLSRRNSCPSYTLVTSLVGGPDPRAASPVVGGGVAGRVRWSRAQPAARVWTCGGTNLDGDWVHSGPSTTALRMLR